MQKNDLLKNGGALLRVLAIDGERCMVIDCIKLTMPRWVSVDCLKDWEFCPEDDDCASAVRNIKTSEELTPSELKTMHDRYSLVAPVLPFVNDETLRSDMVSRIAEMNSVTKQTVRKYLCIFLAAQKIESLRGWKPRSRTAGKECHSGPLR